MAYTAIETKFLGPTDFRGSRVKAVVMDDFDTLRGERKQSVTISWRHDLDSFDNHERAAWALVEKLGLTGVVALAAGGTSHGYAFVPLNSYMLTDLAGDKAA